MAAMSWRDAMKLQNVTEAKKNDKNTDAAKELAAALQDMAVQPECTIVNGKPFYKAQMHCRAALQECTRKDLERIIKVANEMLAPIEEEERKHDKFLNDMATVRKLYREDPCGCESLLEFLTKLSEK